MEVEEIKPYSSEAGKADQVRAMFDAIAPAYDFMNRAMTIGVDKWWRHVAVNKVALPKPVKILDLATGTGDLAIAVARRLPEASITGVDLSEKMLNIAARKIDESGLKQRIPLVQADGTALPFPDASFDCVTIAYGIRNFEDIEKGYREMLRVLKPGGIIVVLELSTPTNALALCGYRFYTRWVIPVVGRAVSRDCRAYSYLPESIAAVPQRHNMTAIMHKAGFSDVTYRAMTMGTCCLYTGCKKV